jgi:hypothetical protein
MERQTDIETRFLEKASKDEGVLSAFIEDVQDLRTQFVEYSDTEKLDPLRTIMIDNEEDLIKKAFYYLLNRTVPSRGKDDVLLWIQAIAYAMKSGDPKPRNHKLEAAVLYGLSSLKSKYATFKPAHLMTSEHIRMVSQYIDSLSKILSERWHNSPTSQLKVPSIPWVSGKSISSTILIPRLTYYSPPIETHAPFFL